MRRKSLPGPRLSRPSFPITQQSLGNISGKAFLFWRDLPLGIMPMRNRTDRPGYDVRLEPADATLEPWLMRLMDIGQFSKSTLAGAVVDFVAHLTRDIGFRGEAFYEIVSSESNQSPAETALAPLPPTEVQHRRGSYRQLIPEADRSPGEPTVVVIPENRLWYVTLPPLLGRPAQHRAMLAELGRQEPFAGFALQSERLGSDAGYDFSVHRRASDIATERATKAWGTIPSLRQVSGTTEYFFIARSLQFLHSQALLREHIVAELNRLLTRLGTKSSLVVEGLPAAALLAEQMQGLEKGEIGFKTALDASRV